MRLKRWNAFAVVLVVGLFLAGCQATDVVGKVAVTSFNALLDKIPGQITDDTANNYWILTSPAGDQFKWSKDFSGENPDLVVEFDAEPFLKAGLNPEKLPASQYQYDQTTNTIVMPYEFGQDQFKYSGTPTALDSFKKIVETHRDRIGYHETLDHYGIGLGDGNMFEWAKDLTENDKDIVFVLNPQPWIDAGVDPTQIEGWAFAKVEVKNEQGKPEQVDKILRPFNLD